MPPLKTIKKKKRDPKKKLKKKKSASVVPQESKANDSDWWDSFRKNNSPISDSSEEEDFKYFFHVSKKTFEYICSLVREDLISRPPSGLINIEGRLLSVEKQVAIALRRLASGDSQVSVGASFGVGQSTVSQVTWRFIEAMEQRGKHHLEWPNSNRMEEIKSKFNSSFGFTNCCGAMDVTHIIMTLPAVETSDDWCDQEKNISMFLQGIVDDEMRFLDIVTGWPGAMPVSILLKFSGFYKLCEGGHRLNGNTVTTNDGLEIREYIMGGVFYPLLPWLMTPHQGNGISAAESKFTELHEGVRSLAVKAFSLLKGTWRILSKVMWRPDKQKLPSLMLVCCLLHNIIIDSGDNLLPDVASLDHHDSGYRQLCCKQVDPLGKTMRDNLVKHLQLSKEKARPN